MCVFFLRSKFGGQSPAKSVRTIKMASSSNTVPSIVVYVTVPNKEAGSCFFFFFFDFVIQFEPIRGFGRNLICLVVGFRYDII